jgi:alanyl-tRNA synthetase
VITAVAADELGWPTTAFHLGVELSDIELDVPSMATDQLAALESAVAAVVRSARPVTARWVPQAMLSELDVRTRGLPERHEGDVRLVEIANLELNTCGGTHVRSTAEIEAVKLLHTESLRGGTRLYFVAGGRVRRRLDEHEARAAELRRLLGAPDEELVETAAFKIERAGAEAKRARALEGALAEVTAEALAGRPGIVVDAHFDAMDAGFLTGVARAFCAVASGKVALLTAGAGEAGAFVVAASAGLDLDVQSAGGDVADALAGRGGGTGAIFQGKAGDLGGRDAARERLIRRVAG